MIGSHELPTFSANQARAFPKIIKNLNCGKLSKKDTKRIREKQDGLIQELEILLACNAAPPVRRLASSALAVLFSKGSFKSSFFTTTLFLGNPFGAYQIVNKCNDLLKAKDEGPQGQRLFALEVIGKLYRELGRLLGSCFPDTVFSLLKSLKQHESRNLFRIYLSHVKRQHLETLSAESNAFMQLSLYLLDWTSLHQ